MNSEDILKALANDLKPELDKLLSVSANPEICSWCDLEVPFQIVGVYKDCTLTQHPGGVTASEGKWKLARGPLAEEHPGLLRDYTGWADIRMRYVNPDYSKCVDGAIAHAGRGVVLRTENRRLLVCPSCLATSGLLSAKYLHSADGCAPVRVDPEPNRGMCSHNADIDKCLVCSPKKEPCKSQHYPGVVCGDCGDMEPRDEATHGS
jgi:hypothetical protein